MYRGPVAARRVQPRGKLRARADQAAALVSQYCSPIMGILSYCLLGLLAISSAHAAQLRLNNPRFIISAWNASSIRAETWVTACYGNIPY